MSSPNNCDYIVKQRWEMKIIGRANEWKHSCNRVFLTWLCCWVDGANSGCWTPCAIEKSKVECKIVRDNSERSIVIVLELTIGSARRWVHSFQLSDLRAFRSISATFRSLRDFLAVSNKLEWSSGRLYTFNPPDERRPIKLQAMVEAPGWIQRSRDSETNDDVEAKLEVFRAPGQKRKKDGAEPMKKEEKEEFQFNKSWWHNTDKTMSLSVDSFWLRAPLKAPLFFQLRGALRAMIFRKLDGRMTDGSFHMMFRLYKSECYQLQGTDAS